MTVYQSQTFLNVSLLHKFIAYMLHASGSLKIYEDLLTYDRLG